MKQPSLVLVKTEPSPVPVTTHIALLGYDLAVLCRSVTLFKLALRIAPWEMTFQAVTTRTLLSIIFHKRIERIRVRAREGNRLAEPLIIDRDLKTLADEPRTADEILAAQAVKILFEPLLLKLRQSNITSDAFWRDFSGDVWKNQEPIRSLTEPTIREIMISWK